MKLKICALGLAKLMLLACGTDPSMTVESLITQHAEARGGVVAIEKIRSIRVDLEITEPGFTVTGRYVATRDGYARIDIYAEDQRVFTEAISPDGGWQLPQGQTVAADLSVDGEKALKRGLIGNLYGLHELPDLGYEFSLVGRVDRDGREYWAVGQIAPDGTSKRLYFDPESLLVVREQQTSALHPDVNSTKTDQETILEDYQDTDGVLFARHSEMRECVTGEVVQTVIVTDIQTNTDIDLAMFTHPD